MRSGGEEGATDITGKVKANAIDIDLAMEAGIGADTLDADAVVIGAGVAGSGMAYALAKRGWNVVLLDKAKFPRHKACGEFLSPESQSTLRAWGLDGAVQACGPAAMTAVRLHTERGASLEVPLSAEAMGISRFALDSVLQASAAEAGARLLEGYSVTSVLSSESGYRVECINSNKQKLAIHARIAIGAGGRRMGNLLRERRPEIPVSSYIGIKSHFTRSDRMPIVDLYFFRGGYLGIAPVERDRFNVAAIVRRSVYPKLPASAAIERILGEATRRIPALKERLAGAAPIPGTEAAAYPVTISSGPCAWSGMPLIGDAAAVIPPFCGDGMAMALRSAELCAPHADAYLRGEATLSQWRDVYTRQLEQHLGDALRWGSRLERMLSRPGFASLLLRVGRFAPGLAERAVRATRLRE